VIFTISIAVKNETSIKCQTAKHFRRRIGEIANGVYDRKPEKYYPKAIPVMFSRAAKQYGNVLIKFVTLDY